MMSILICYKGAHLFTHVHEENFILNILYGLLGAALMVVVHEAMHFVLYKAFAKRENHKFANALELLRAMCRIKYLRSGNISRL